MSNRRTTSPAIGERPPRAIDALLRLLLALMVCAAATTSVLVLMASTVQAEGLDASQVLRAIEERTGALNDLTFLLEGEIRDEAGQRIAVEIEVMAMPNLPAASLYIIQPDALADNQVVIDADEIRNYTFLTNQVSVFHADDPDALGGLFPEAAGATFDLDVGRVFQGWDVSIVSVEAGPDGEVYELRFDNLAAEAPIDHVLASIDADTWLPFRLVFFRDGDQLFADLRFVDMVVDQGLTRAEVTFLPDDAEVIDRRR
ncbi:outer membrane lipoprotein carrier protein LolA [soil metagenome]